MKKIFILLMFLFLIIALPVFADDMDSGGIDGMSQYSSAVENAFAGQKKVTDEDFQKALDQVKSKQKKKKKNKPFKGENFNEENSGRYLDETAEKNLLLSLPVALNNSDGAEIPIGHYKIIGKKINDKVYLDFYQSYTLVARVPATETDNDFNETAINFVKLIPYDEKRVEVIYGSMDFNAYTFIKIEKDISDTN